jgi:hypothetical protein
MTKTCSIQVTDEAKVNLLQYFHFLAQLTAPIEGKLFPKKRRENIAYDI